MEIGAGMTVGTLPLYNPDGRLRGHYVYMVLCCESGPIFIKIGHSKSPFQRLNDLRVGCPLVPRILAVLELPGRHLAKRMEGDLHRALMPWRRHGEWFAFEHSDKIQFNQQVARVVGTYRTPCRILRWHRFSVPKLIADGQRRMRALQSRHAKSSLAYRDFKTANQS